ncbi:MAG: GxxExxY protein, partial [Candidatus Cloacimonetes bacterium]|nr:GxxExxY protein [Candidatus Cloacimonadota bacterium]
MSKLLYEDLTDKIIRAAIEVHKNLGPGLLESAYEECFLFELIDIGLIVKQQITIPIKYKDIN